MEQRPPGRTGADVGVTGWGTWQLGSDRGDVDDQTAAEVPTAAFALRWVVDQPGVTTVIPGARNVAQVGGDVAAALPPLTETQLADLERVCDQRIRAHVHDRW